MHRILRDRNLHNLRGFDKDGNWDEEDFEKWKKEGGCMYQPHAQEHIKPKEDEEKED